MYNILIWIGSFWKILWSSYVLVLMLFRKGNCWFFCFMFIVCWILVFYIVRFFNNVGNILLVKVSFFFKVCFWFLCIFLGFVGVGYVVFFVYRCICYVNYLINKWNIYIEWNFKILKFCDWIIFVLVDIYSNDWM